MDDNIIRPHLATLEERDIGGDLILEELGRNSQPSDKTDDLEPALVTTEKDKASETENVVALSRSELNNSISKSFNGHSELDTEKGMKANELNNQMLEYKSANDNTPEKNPQYSYNVEQILKSIYQNSDVSINSSTVQLLADGFMKRFVPSLVKAQSSISQIKSSQSVLIETVQQETSKFTDFRSIIDLKETMVRAKQYHNKLLKIRKDMTDLHEKSRRLKKRALKLQQQKQKEELTRAHSMEKEFEKERMLTARVAPAHD